MNPDKLIIVSVIFCGRHYFTYLQGKIVNGRGVVYAEDFDRFLKSIGCEEGDTFSLG